MGEGLDGVTQTMRYVSASMTVHHITVEGISYRIARNMTTTNNVGKTSSFIELTFL
jgi:hypothetical protein